ncbi:MAG: hypothetical protein VX768_16105 [Planctomycetota bacterium]|nr:hypothetical protein [Planctomycetota bacterium]
MKIRLILSILLLGIALGYTARLIRYAVTPAVQPFDSSIQLLDESDSVSM